MRAMILAAGLGRRMQSLVRDTPKPMLEIAGRPLLEHLVTRLVAHGVRTLAINHSRRGEQIERHFGDGRRWNAVIRYSPEGEAPLGVLAGVAQALPLLGDAPFLLVSADVWTDYPFRRLRTLRPGVLAHLVLADNPGHHPHGDFPLRGGRISPGGGHRHTYCGIGLYDPEVFHAPRGEFGARLLRLAEQGRISGERYAGAWLDVGTPERLARARVLASAGSA